jgi:hypothetical protein
MPLIFDPGKKDSCLNSFREVFSDPLKSGDNNSYDSGIILPLDFTLEMDGISGLIPHSAFVIPSNSLPEPYKIKSGPDAGKQRIAFILHTIEQNFNNSKWTTKISGQTLNIRFEPLTSTESTSIQTAKAKQKSLKELANRINRRETPKSKGSTTTTTRNETPPSENNKNNTTSSANVILMGGLDNRPGDLNITQQVEKLKKNIPAKTIIGFRYMEISKVKNAISNYPDATVVLFSAGCLYSKEVSSVIKDKTKLFIVEPYAPNGNSSVSGAVANGVPAKNVVTGPTGARGNGVVSGSTKTPNGTSHWGALEFVGKLI